MATILLPGSLPDSQTLVNLRDLLARHQRLAETAAMFVHQQQEVEVDIEREVLSYNAERARLVLQAFIEAGLGVCTRLNHAVEISQIAKVKMTYHDGEVKIEYLCSKCMEVMSRSDSRKYKPVIETISEDVGCIETTRNDPSCGRLDRAIENWSIKQTMLPPRIRYYALTGPSSVDGPGWYLGASKLVLSHE